MSCNKNGAQNLESFSKSAVWEKFKLARNVSPDQQVSFWNSNLNVFTEQFHAPAILIFIIITRQTFPISYKINRS